MEETYLNEIKAILNKSIANNVLNGKKVKHFKYGQEKDKSVYFLNSYTI